ncbi:hypothetical protein [Streptomyces roseifaciens]|uniref:hypothetical protein n=1 Tax=Streptomyces roseifaciens TaxID=1488406 RepID=UPI0007180241|nr:hypothetical protein [Streptomyces roseifaciens]
MIDSSRSGAASQSTLANTAIALLMSAIALITLALSISDDLGDPAFFALIAAELVLIATMGALYGATHAQSIADTAQRQRDEGALDALEPLHGGEQR